MKTETTIQGLSASLNPCANGSEKYWFRPDHGELASGHLNLVREAKNSVMWFVVPAFCESDSIWTQ